MKIAYSCPRLPCPGIDRRPEEERRKVFITGSKGLTNKHWPWFYKMCDRVTFPLLDPIILTLGHSDDLVDKFAMNWASYNWLTLKVYYPDSSQHRLETKAEQKREETIVADTDYILLFWDGMCKWTPTMATRAKQAGKKVKAFKF